MKNFKTSEDSIYLKAKKKANNIRSFYYNLTVYCIVIPILIFINLKFVPEFHWFWFSLIGWGTGVIIHGMEAFELNPFLGKDWEERKLNEIMEKEKQKYNNITKS